MAPRRKNIVTSDQVASVRDPAVIASLEPAPIVAAPEAVPLDPYVAKALERSQAGVLTDTEVNADLEALGVEFDPHDSLEDRTALRNEARAARDTAPAPEPSGIPEYPHLTMAQIVALDRIDDGVTKPGGSPEGGNKPAAPVVVEYIVGEGGATGRNAAAPKPAPRPTDMVRVRITKAGAGQVFTGQTNPQTYAWNDEPSLPRSVGLALEGKHFGEILD